MHIASEEEEEPIEILNLKEEEKQEPQSEGEGPELDQLPECPNHGPSNFRRGKPRTF